MFLSLVCHIQPELKPRGHVTIPNFLPLLQPPDLDTLAFQTRYGCVDKTGSQDIKGDLTKNKFSCAPALTKRGWRHSPTSHSGKKQSVQWNRNCLDRLEQWENNMLKEICYPNKDGARRDVLPEGIIDLRRCVAWGDMQPWGGTMLKVSSQRSIQHWG